MRNKSFWKQPAVLKMVTRMAGPTPFLFWVLIKLRIPSFCPSITSYSLCVWHVSYIRELLKGPLYYALSITYACAVYWRYSPISIGIICNLCAGDGMLCWADIISLSHGYLSDSVLANSKKLLFSCSRYCWHCWQEVWKTETPIQ